MWALLLSCTACMTHAVCTQVEDVAASEAAVAAAAAAAPAADSSALLGPLGAALLGGGAAAAALFPKASTADAAASPASQHPWLLCMPSLQHSGDPARSVSPAHSPLRAASWWA